MAFNNRWHEVYTVLLNHILWKRRNLIFTIPVFLILIQAHKTISAKLNSSQSTSSQIVFNKRNKRKRKFPKAYTLRTSPIHEPEVTITYRYDLKVFYLLSVTH